MNWKQAPHHSENYLHSLYDLAGSTPSCGPTTTRRTVTATPSRPRPCDRRATSPGSGSRPSGAQGPARDRLARPDHRAPRRVHRVRGEGERLPGRPLEGADQGLLDIARSATKFLRNAHPDIANHKLSVADGPRDPRQAAPDREDRQGRPPGDQEVPPCLPPRARRVERRLAREQPGLLRLRPTADLDLARRRGLTGPRPCAGPRQDVPGARLADLHDRDRGPDRRHLLRPTGPEIGAIAYGQNGLWVARHAGYAAVKDQSTGGYLVVSSSFHTWHHKHADDTGFELYDRNQGSSPTRPTTTPRAATSASSAQPPRTRS